MVNFYAERIEATECDINNKTHEKELALEASEQADATVNSTWEQYNNDRKNKENLESCRRNVERKIEELRSEMKMAVSRATLQGKTTAEIETLKESYNLKIGELEGTLTQNTSDGKSITDLFEKAEKEYTNARFNDIASESWLLSILSDLFSLFIDKGKYEQANIVYNHMTKIDVDA